jgi:hypothetical protein
MPADQLPEEPELDERPQPHRQAAHARRENRALERPAGKIGAGELLGHVHYGPMIRDFLDQILSVLP